MKKKQIKFLKKIVETPSPTGSETQVAEIVRERLVPIADEIRTDTMGSVQATYEGWLHSVAPLNKLAEEVEQMMAEADRGDDELQIAADDGASVLLAGLAEEAFDSVFEEANAAASEDAEALQGGSAAKDAADALPQMPPLRLMLAAHMDEVGLMVTYISDDGFLSVSSIGGVDAAILPGMRVDVHAAGGVLRGVVGRKPIHLIDPDDRKNVTPLDKLVIDLGLPAKKVKKLVRVGDSITYGVGFERFGKDMAVSRAFDDKVGVFITCRVMEALAANDDYNGIFTGAITVQEEIGTRGAMTSAHAVMPDVALAFDVTHATDYPGIDKTKHGKIVCGAGPVIARGPNINPVVFERLVAAAEACGIPYQIEAEPSVTGTDARAIQVTREGIPTGLVSVPLRYMHTPTEVISLEDVENTVKLIERFALDLDDASDFVPGHPLDYMSVEKLESLPFEDDYYMLTSEVEQLSEDVADLQALAEGQDELESYYSEFADGVLTPENAPFGRQQSMLSAEFAALDLDAKTIDYATEAEVAAMPDVETAIADNVVVEDVAAPGMTIEGLTIDGMPAGSMLDQDYAYAVEEASAGYDAPLAQEVEYTTPVEEAVAGFDEQAGYEEAPATYEEAAEAALDAAISDEGLEDAAEEQPVVSQLDMNDMLPSYVTQSDAAPVEENAADLTQEATFFDASEEDSGEYDEDEYEEDDECYDEDEYEDDEYEDEDEDDYEDDEYYDDDDEDYEDDDYYEDDDEYDEDDEYYDDDDEYDEEDDEYGYEQSGAGPSVSIQLEQDEYAEEAAPAQDAAQQGILGGMNVPVVMVTPIDDEE